MTAAAQGACEWLQTLSRRSWEAREGVKEGSGVIMFEFFKAWFQATQGQIGSSLETWQTPAGHDGGLDFDSDRVWTARSEFLVYSFLEENLTVLTKNEQIPSGSINLLEGTYEDMCQGDQQQDDYVNIQMMLKCYAAVEQVGQMCCYRSRRRQVKNTPCQIMHYYPISVKTNQYISVFKCSEATDGSDYLGKIRRRLLGLSILFQTFTKKYQKYQSVPAVPTRRELALRGKGGGQTEFST